VCGIAGAVGGDAARVAAMVDNLRHRGPDDHGCAARVGPAGRVVLGAARLAVIDLSPAGHMPMIDEGTGNALAYNGEVYNFRELRAELAGEGTLFVSGTDTEVVLKAYARWGEDFLSRLHGMFAFAIHDARTGALLLARDRLGEKPLYYTTEGPFLFASEVRALLASGQVARRLDPAALEVYLANGFLVGPTTMLRDVRSLLPGHVMRVDARGQVQGTRAYWSLPAEAGPRAPEAEETLRSALEHSVRARLISDVPLGAFLSGGLDSTANVALMARAGGDVCSFSITFDEPEFDESKHSREVAQLFRTKHTEVRLRRPEFEAWLEQAISAQDQPSFDGLNTYYVSRAARESGLTVALSGAGADELFGGYPYFRQVPWMRRLARAPLRSLSRVLGLEAALADRPFAVAGWSKAAQMVVGDDAGPDAVLAAYQATQTLFPPWTRRALLSPEVQEAAAGKTRWGLPLDFVQALRPELASHPELEQISRASLRLFLGERCLRDIDSMSMAVSLEVRAPFVDHQVVEAALRVPAKERCRGIPHKPFQREALLPFLGPGYPARRKQGFLFPFERWLRHPESQAGVRQSLQGDAARAMGLVPRELAGLGARFFAGQGRIPWSRIWALNCLLSWCRAHRVTA
jgi:asparagine synthase (glutamine-hydrolysing)